jgi:hypothetical protein
VKVYLSLSFAALNLFARQKQIKQFGLFPQKISRRERNFRREIFIDF